MVSSQNLEGFFVSAFADQESRGFTGEDQQDQLKTARGDLEELIEDESVTPIQGFVHESSLFTQGSLHDQSPEMLRVPKQTQAAMMDPTRGSN